MLLLQPDSVGPGGDGEEAEGGQGPAGEAAERESESPVVGKPADASAIGSDTAVRPLTPPPRLLPADASVFATPVCHVGAQRPASRADC